MGDSITNVVFDVGGVLAAYHQQDYFEKLGYPADVAARLVQATMKSPDWKEYDRGVLTDEEVRARFKRRAPELSREIDESLTHMRGMVTGLDYAIPWVKSLRERGIRTYVLSNFSRTCYQDCQAALSFETLMNGCLWSYEYHLIKPDDAIFLQLLHMFGLNPGETVFLDDTLANVEAAARLGIHGIHFTSRAEAEESLLSLLESGSNQDSDI